MRANRITPVLELPEATAAELLAGAAFEISLSSAPGDRRAKKRHVYFPRVELAAANGAITIRNSVVFLTKAGVAAMTLAAPSTAQNGTIIKVVSATTNAHTITAPSNIIHFGDSGGAKDVCTFAAYKGAQITFIAYGGEWYVLGLTAVTIA